MNLQQLEYLLAIKKYRHYVKAAEACGVTQPTLSAMIQKLEEELGVKLIDRSSQPHNLTPVGDRIAEKAVEVLNGVGSIEDIAKEEKGGLTGHVRIGILPTISPFLLPRLIPAQHRLSPDLELQFVELTTAECEDKLKENEIDVAIVAGDLSEDSCEVVPLYFEEFIGYVSRNEPLFESKLLKSSEVNPKSLWLLDEGHCFRNQLVRFCSLEVVHDRRIDYNLGGIETYMHLVEAGHGITFVPELAIQTMGPRQKELLRPFALPRPVRPIILIHNPTYMRRSIIDHLTDIIKSVVPEEMLKLRQGQTLA